MSDSGGLTPIELSLRDVEPPSEAIVVVRAGPLTADKLVEHARRELARYSYGGEPVPTVSVDATVAGWTLDAILRHRLWSRSTYATTTVGALRSEGYLLRPTFKVPHFDIVLPMASLDAATTLLSLFGPAARNPHRRRR